MFGRDPVMRGEKRVLASQWDWCLHQLAQVRGGPTTLWPPWQRLFGFRVHGGCCRETSVHGAAQAACRKSSFDILNHQHLVDQLVQMGIPASSSHMSTASSPSSRLFSP